MKKFVFLILLSVIISLFFINPILSCEELADKDYCFSCYLADSETGYEMYSYNADKKHQIASMVKIMTLNLVFDKIYKGELSLEDKILVSSKAASMGGSQMYLDANEEYDVLSLLKGVIISSANDAAYAFAEKIGGSGDNFVRMMNDKALSLGMVNTKFANPTGLPSENEQYSTARDVNIMTRLLSQNKTYVELANIKYEEFKHNSGRVTTLANTNKLLNRYKYCLCGKTGFTNDAMFCLSCTALKNNVKCTATVVGASSSKARFDKIIDMCNYAFANYSCKTIYSNNQVVKNVEVIKTIDETLDLVVEKDINILSKDGENLFKYELVTSDFIEAPVNVGDVVGYVRVYGDNYEKKYPVYAKRSVNKAGFIDYLLRDLKK